MLINQISHKDSEIPTASLADIVFLLLIFFLVTTNINIEKGISLVLPQNEDVLPVPTENIIHVLINQSGLIAINGDPVQLNEMSGIIKDRLLDNPKLIVSLKTDKATDYNVYIRVLDKLKIAWGNNPSRISIA